MFTGLVSRIAGIESIEDRSGARRFRIARRAAASAVGDVEPWSDVELGESIAVSGVCLTVVGRDDALEFDVVEETLRRSTLGSVTAGRLVNLERALRVGDRLGGHIVSGHVDAVGTVVDVKDDADWIVTFEVDSEKWPEFRTIDKGSVTVEGCSLTVVDPAANRFSVALVPHTREVTTLGALAIGDSVNLEMDQVGKWIAELVRPIAPSDRASQKGPR